MLYAGVKAIELWQVVKRFIAIVRDKFFHTALYFYYVNQITVSVQLTSFQSDLYLVMV